MLLRWGTSDLQTGVNHNHEPLQDIVWFLAVEGQSVDLDGMLNLKLDLKAVALRSDKISEDINALLNGC